ncbi:ABC transporter permease [Leucobacter sp. 1207-22]|uniref:ABC transporter permease n=1 Tax=Leucobacter sp. 1207-22 TaxID=2604456 RepID=UPI004064BEA3
MTENAAINDSDFSTPGASRGLVDVFKHRYLLQLLLKKGISTRYYGSALGWVWSYIRPLAQFLMYYLVFGVILDTNKGLPLFPVYLVAGIVAVNLFSEALRNTTSAIVDNKALVKKIFMPRELFPVAAVGVALVHFLPQALVLLVVALFLGWTISFAAVGAFLLGVFIILLFALGLGLFFGALNVAYRDSRNFVDLILMFATWTSPVLYSWTMIRDRAPDWLYNLYMANPMTTAVELFHDAFWLPMAGNTSRPDHMLLNIGIGLAISIITLLVGQLVFRRLEGKFAQTL